MRKKTKKKEREVKVFRKVKKKDDKNSERAMKCIEKRGKIIVGTTYTEICGKEGNIRADKGRKKAFKHRGKLRDLES